MKKNKELIKFLKRLNAEEGYLVMKKLDECDTEPITEFTNDLYDGSKIFLRMKEILTNHKIFMVRKAVNFVINRVT
jgi:selenocysteine-specific translation elongation factor